jgi:hypothetical protein
MSRRSPRAGPTLALPNGSFKIHKGVATAFNHISLRGTRVSALVVPLFSTAADTAPV